MQITIKTPNGEQTITCDGYAVRAGEGINGPYVIDFFEGTGEARTLIAGAARVFEFAVVAPE